MLEKDISEKISEVFIEAARRYFKDNLATAIFPEDADAFLQPTKETQHGDMTSSIAMRLAKAAKMPPAALAEGIKPNIEKLLAEKGFSSYVGKVEVKAGFLNIWLSDEYLRNLLLKITKEKNDFGRSVHGEGKRVNIEFVSANPTGPLTIAHGRQAAIGDALSRILKFNGYNTTTEYYLNDFGRQINLLGRSVEARYRNLLGFKEDMPEDGYQGDYIIDIARKVQAEKGDKLLERGPETEKFFREYAVSYMMELIRKDLADFKVSFDVWTSQGALETRGEVEKTLAKLKENGHIYEEEGARWFASTKLGDDKNRVVVKSDGSYTYLAPDMAYHDDKYKRGYDRLIDLLGPDHHGYIGRMKAAVQALGHEAKSLDILIVQLVTLMRAGEEVKMSTRQGTFVTLREIIDEIGADVARFVFLTRRLDSHLDFDIELAKKESADNPVFYIQYAHARICSIKRHSRKRMFSLLFSKKDLTLLKHDEEKALIRKLSEFPLAVKLSADTLEPSKLVTYLSELARSFHSFYTECRVVSDDMALTKTRLFLVECVRTVLANGLNLLNISLPEKM